ncbi:hypothetical protein SXCC_04217 [Gluconacetobacter sp. SXCC-1]|nr:hypothetical protein SXCC_04217 [Gluconacetobacter sp. SXCC-1]
MDCHPGIHLRPKQGRETSDRRQGGACPSFFHINIFFSSFFWFAL